MRDRTAYRDEILRQIEDLTDDLAGWESGTHFTAKRNAGDTAWVDTTAASVSNAKYLLMHYRNILADLDRRAG